MLSNERRFESDHVGELGGEIDGGFGIQSITDNGGNDGFDELDRDRQLGEELDDSD